MRSSEKIYRLTLRLPLNLATVSTGTISPINWGAFWADIGQEVKR